VVHWLQDGKIKPEEYDLLCKGPRAVNPPPMNDDVACWMNESSWSALVSLTQLPAFTTLIKDIEKNNDEWER
jgi:hypothetical protein